MQGNIPDKAWRSLQANLPSDSDWELIQRVQLLRIGLSDAAIDAMDNLERYEIISISQELDRIDDKQMAVAFRGGR